MTGMTIRSLPILPADGIILSPKTAEAVADLLDCTADDVRLWTGGEATPPPVITAAAESWLTISRYPRRSPRVAFDHVGHGGVIDIMQQG